MNEAIEKDRVLRPETKVVELLDAFPFLMDELEAISPRYKALRNPLMRSTVGRVATLRMAATIGNIPLSELMMAVATAVEKQTGVQFTLDSGGPEGRDPRLEELKGLILSLHSGMELEEAKKKFEKQFGDISAGEIAQMEQQLIAEGLPAEDIQKLCDVHVGVFRESLDRQVPPDEKPGHPAQTLREENVELKRKTAALRKLLGEKKVNLKEVATLLDNLAEVEKHYLRKEHELFPRLERKGFTGPSQVMWAIHDEIRAELKRAREAASTGDTDFLRRELSETLRKMDEMVYKEEAILLPTSLELLEHEDWAAIHRQEAEIGFAWVKRGDEWNPRIKINLPPSPDRREIAAKAVEAHGGSLPRQPETNGTEKIAKEAKEKAPMIDLEVGSLTPEQINLILLHLPVELSFVDEHDEVRYYTGLAHKIFPRTEGAIGRKVQNCHPPKSLHLVNRILDEMKAGTRDTAEFWMEDFKGRFVHIRYDAVRDRDGNYRGCLEAVQDIGHLRELSGSHRLLDEEAAA